MSDAERDPPVSPTRRRLFQSIALAPLAAAAAMPASSNADAARSAAPAYAPSFFNATEWAFVQAAVDRLIPADDSGPGGLEAGVPEFIDRHMQTPYAAGDIWYMQGPFVEAKPEFGYQGPLPVRDILRMGIKAVDAYSRKANGGKAFAELEHAQQEDLLKQMEAGKLALEEIGAKTFFGQLLGETRLGYFSDPKYGGNKDMGAWKMIGYPGMRADYLDWVTVRDKPYPLPPVDLSGKRG
jgi:gluconate 2-dehydrogenase gamma chain